MEDLGKKEGMANNYGNLGKYLSNARRPDKALSFIKKP